jgi:two-component sensor histidine kinase
MKTSFFISIILITSFAYSQQSKIDSLEIEFRNTSEIDEKIVFLKKIATEAYLKDFEKVKDVLKMANEIGNETNHHAELLLIRRIWGVSLMNNGDFDAAKKQFHKNLSTMDLEKESAQAYLDYMNLSSVFRYKLELDSTQYFIEKAVKIVEETPLKDKYTSAYNNLAAYYFYRGNTSEAIDYYLKALDSAIYLKSKRRVISTYSNLAQIFRETDNCKKSIRYAKQGLEISKELDYKQGIADASLHLGNCFSQLKKSKDSVNIFFETSINIYKEQNDNIFLLEAYENYGAHLSRYEVTDEVIKFKIAALEIAEKLEMNDKIFGIKTSLGADYYELNQYEKSLNYLNLALDDSINITLSNYDHIIELYYYKAKLEEHLGNTKTALVYSFRHANALEQNYELLNRDNLNETEEKYQNEKKEKENLQLQAENTEQELATANANRQKWLFASGLLGALIALVIFFYFYRKTKKQKEVIESLQKELHHRVKNNLSIIDTFIEVAKEEFTDSKFSKKLTELQNRINSINEVHQQLYKNEDVTNLNLKTYIDTLSSNVANSFSNENISIEKSIQGKLNLHADKSFPVGLIINEFLTNSYKYAFGTNAGIVKIEINDKGNTYELALSDNGKGLPENFDIENSESFGLRIIKLLAEQLNGNFALTNNNGVALTIKFPK